MLFGPRSAAQLAATVALAAVLAAPVGVAPLQSRLPAEMPGGAERSRWERVDGEITDAAGQSFTYELWVNPARRGLYEITHYRVSYERTDEVPAHAETEKVVWNQDPGKAPLRLFERVDGVWHPVPAGSAAYLREMAVVMQIYMMHRGVVMTRPPGEP